MDIHTSLVISQADARPMYVQIMEQIRHRVAVGDWPPGTVLPSIRQLAVELTVSVITVKRAYLELERDGVIVTQQGKGSMVADGAAKLGPSLLVNELQTHLESAARLARQLGYDETELVDALRVALDRASNGNGNDD